jgi:hypothetical protein
MQRIFQIMEALNLPKGVLNLVEWQQRCRRCHPG